MFKFRLSFTRPPTPQGAILQLAAATTHRVSDDQLKEMDEKIPKIFVITGDDDSLVKPGNSKHLADQMRRAEFSLFPGAGHAIYVQFPDELNRVLGRSFEEGGEIVEKGGW